MHDVEAPPPPSRRFGSKSEKDSAPTCHAAGGGPPTSGDNPLRESRLASIRVNMRESIGHLVPSIGLTRRFVRGKVTSLSKKHDLPGAVISQQQNLKFPKLKVTVQGQSQVELKLQYDLQKGSKQEYKLQVYIYVPSSLHNSKTLSSLIADAWSIARLRPVKMDLASLASGEATIVHELHEQVHTVANKIKLGLSIKSNEVSRMIRSIKFAGYMYRSTFRDAIKPLQKRLAALRSLDTLVRRSSVDEDLPPPAEPFPPRGHVEAADAVDHVVKQVHAALVRLRETAAPLAGEGMQAEIRRAWVVVDDFVCREAMTAYFDVVEAVGPLEEAGRNPLGGLEPTRSFSGAPVNVMEVLLPGAGRAETVAQCVHDLDEYARETGHILAPDPADPHQNEQFTYTMRNVKYAVREALQLRLQVDQAFWLIDIYGAIIATFAMMFALAAAWLVTKYTDSNFDLLALFVLCVAYAIKDRIKKWGERYFERVLEKLGFDAPGKVTYIEDAEGHPVGRVAETSRSASPGDMDATVRMERDKGKKEILERAERVVIYEKTVQLDTPQFEQLVSKHFDGIYDCLRLNVARFYERMDLPHESHYLVSRQEGEGGREELKPVLCARVYHINMVVRLLSRPPSRGCRPFGGRGKWVPASLERFTVVMDKEGIKRLLVK